jgi:L-alanine-DL-glutamate epimerase-like enolase superfamily enzyme
MFHERLALTDRGTVEVPQGPGLGVTVNWEALAEYKVE